MTQPNSVLSFETAKFLFERRLRVSAKYLIGLLAQVTVMVVTGAAQGIKMAAVGNFVSGEFAVLMLLMLIVATFSSSFSLPFMFKLGVEKGRLGYYIMIGVAAGGSGILAGLSEGNMGSFRMPQLVAPVLALVAAGIYGISWLLSIRFYEKRELR